VQRGTAQSKTGFLTVESQRRNNGADLLHLPHSNKKYISLVFLRDFKVLGTRPTAGRILYSGSAKCAERQLCVFS
jgi:hypothetical protein